MEPISLATFSAPDNLRPSVDDFQSLFDVVFIDGTGYTNLTTDMSSATLNVVGLFLNIQTGKVREFYQKSKNTGKVIEFYQKSGKVIEFYQKYWNEVWGVLASTKRFSFSIAVSKDSHVIYACGFWPNGKKICICKSRNIMALHWHYDVMKSWRHVFSMF